jgi:hypothetical protein
MNGESETSSSMRGKKVYSTSRLVGEPKAASVSLWGLSVLLALSFSNIRLRPEVSPGSRRGHE